MKHSFLILLAVVMAGCVGNNAKQKMIPAIDLANLDTLIAPNQDFYQYATGGWQLANPLKPEFSRYGTFDVLRENNEVRIRDLFAEMAEKQAAAGSVDQKIGDLYRMGMDSTRLNAEGKIPVQGDLEAIDAAEGKKGLTALLASIHRSVANPFFATYVDGDAKNSSQNILYLYQAGLGMGNRDYYLDAENEKFREAYKTYIAKLFEMSGYGEATDAVAAVMDVETRIAKASLSNVELRNPHNNYNMIPVSELAVNYPNIDWKTYFEEMNLAGIDSLSAAHSGVLKVADDVMGGDPVTLKYYLAFNLLDGASTYLSDAFSDANFEFYGRTMSGRQEQRPRWKRALAVPNNVLSEAVGEMYVAKYFPPSSKEKMLKLVGDLQKSLGEHIGNLEWMSPQTKTKALEKLATFTVKIGYPDKWKDYSSLTIDPSLTWWENIKRASAWYNDDQMSEAGKPVDKEKWHMSPQTVNAYYNPSTNEICFPAAILQPPFFNPDADDAVNYGAIGVVIGHEMTHGFDDQGRQFDKEGNLADWWTEEDAKAFNARADKLVAQFDAIEVLPGMHANGRFTLGENIADQGGLRVAYTAMKMAQGDTEPATIDNFSADQRFYLAYATLWGQNIRDEEIARLTKIDEHSLGRWRVDASVRNLDTFFKAFGITDGAMYLAPEERVVIW
jgi:putative endopeptidase